MTPEFTTEQGCRAEILRRNTSCYLECDVCKAQCTSPLARALVNTWKCSAGLPVGGINAAVRVSDQGNDMVKRHGANVNNGGVPTPDEIYPEIHETLINNDVTYPRVIRNSVSCRKAHRESIYGRFTPGLDDEGKPIRRKGFMVPCNTNSDCHTRCGEHPIHSDSYVCVKNANFYDWTNTSDFASNFYNEPGGDVWDVQNSNTTSEWLGTCMCAAQKSESNSNRGAQHARTASLTVSIEAAWKTWGSAVAPALVGGRMVKAGSLEIWNLSTSSGASVTMTRRCSNE